VKFHFGRIQVIYLQRSGHERIVFCFLSQKNFHCGHWTGQGNRFIIISISANWQIRWVCWRILWFDRWRQISHSHIIRKLPVLNNSRSLNSCLPKIPRKALLLWSDRIWSRKSNLKPLSRSTLKIFCSTCSLHLHPTCVWEGESGGSNGRCQLNL